MFALATELFPPFPLFGISVHTHERRCFTSVENLKISKKIEDFKKVQRENALKKLKPMIQRLIFDEFVGSFKLCKVNTCSKAAVTIDQSACLLPCFLA